MIETPRRGKLSKLAKRLLWAAVPISVLVGFAIWVHGKTEFTPDFLERHGFKFYGGFMHGFSKGGDFDGYVYEAKVPLGTVLGDFEKEMTNRGFVVEITDFTGHPTIEVSNGGIMLGFLLSDGQVVKFYQYRIDSIQRRVQLATGWRFIP